MHPELNRTERWALSCSFTIAVAVLANTCRGAGDPLIACFALSAMAFIATYSIIRWVGQTFLKANLKGRDMSKLKRPEIPETMGGVCAAVYLLLMMLFIPFLFYPDIVKAMAWNHNLSKPKIPAMHERILHGFPLEKLASYQSAILSLALVVILGNYDDLFDIRWRHKVLIPAVASIPLLTVYHLTYGVTHVVVPVPLEWLFGPIIDLGWLYYVYMAAIAIFCPNSINILAGINGIEVSQSLVVSILLLVNDLLSLLAIPGDPMSHPATDLHLFSIYLLLPFIGVSLALLKYNWYPAAVFVGDTYCYFAGMVFAIVGILGHFSKTLLLLLLPQIFNFAYSSPQLFHLIPCPRHRLPRFNSRTGLLEPSMTPWPQQPRYPAMLLLKALANFPCLPLIKLEKDAMGRITESSNMTILNLWLVWFGPKRENRLAIELLLVQSLIGAAGLLVRHELAFLVFRQDNRA